MPRATRSFSAALGAILNSEITNRALEHVNGRLFIAEELKPLSGAWPSWKVQENPPPTHTPVAELVTK